MQKNTCHRIPLTSLVGGQRREGCPMPKHQEKTIHVVDQDQDAQDLMNMVGIMFGDEVGHGGSDCLLFLSPLCLVSLIGVIQQTK